MQVGITQAAVGVVTVHTGSFALGYGVAVGSYNRQMFFNYVCEARLMPDLNVMADAVEEAFAELLGEARKINAPLAAAAEVESVTAKIRKSQKRSDKKLGKKSGKNSAGNATKKPAA